MSPKGISRRPAGPLQVVVADSAGVKVADLITYLQDTTGHRIEWCPAGAPPNTLVVDRTAGTNGKASS